MAARHDPVAIAEDGAQLRFTRLRRPAIIPTHSDERSPYGCSALVAAERGDDILGLGADDAGHHAAAVRRDKRRAMKLAQPLPEDALRPGTCLRCGLYAPGGHRSAAECIAELRDRLAMAER